MIDRRAWLGLLAAAPALARRALAGAGAARAVPYRAGRSDADSGLACARMCLAFFEPQEHWPVTDLLEMTGATDGKWFFEPQLGPILLEKGRKLELHSDLPYPALAQGRGVEMFGPEAGKYFDAQGLRWALGQLGSRAPAAGLPLAEALGRWRAGGFLMLAVDPAVLRSDEGLAFGRCYLVVTGLFGDQLRYHDPSLGPDRTAPLELLERAYNAPRAGRSALWTA